jgi:NAD(P)-dependent dehydrogenase (short-subunit alcohol dehydrogenase family)
MLLYAHSGADLALTLRRYLAAPPEAEAAELARAVERGGRWIRFGASASPEADCARLLGQFTERFGAPPVANQPSPSPPDPDETSGS